MADDVNARPLAAGYASPFTEARWQNPLHLLRAADLASGGIGEPARGQRKRRGSLPSILNI